MDVHCCGAVGSIKDGRDDFVELVFADSFDFCAIGCAQDNVEDGNDNNGLDLMALVTHSFMSMMDWLIVFGRQASSLAPVRRMIVAGVGGVRSGFVAARSFVTFFALLKTALTVMASVEWTWLMIFSAFSRSFLIPFLVSLVLKIVVR